MVTAVCWCVATLGFVFSPAPVAAEDVTLKILNQTGHRITVQVASEKRTDAGRWVSRSIQDRAGATITLRSPDNYLVEVQIGRKRFASEPVALKAKIAANPGSELVVGIPPRAAPGDQGNEIYSLYANQISSRDGLFLDEGLQFSLDPPGRRNRD